MLRFAWLSWVLLLATVATAVAQAASPCEQVIAPLEASFHAPNVKSPRPTNEGIYAPGFVNVRSGPVVHGIDVSKYQLDTDFDRAKQCGAEFVYVRLSGGERAANEPLYRIHWRDARYANLLLGPYHNLALNDSRQPASEISTAELDALRTDNLTYATRQAELFTSRLLEMLRKDAAGTPEASPNVLGLPYLPIVIDATWRPQAAGDTNDKKTIGSIYSAAICKWLQVVDSEPKIHGQTKILFTSAMNYRDYDFASAPCDLSSMPVWIMDPTVDADKQDTDQRPGMREAIRNMCNVGGRDRCIIQHYTSFGGFAIFGSGEQAGLNLDRFYGTTQQLALLLQRASR